MNLRRSKTIGVATILMFLAGCSDFSGPSNEDIIDSTGLTVHDATQIVEDNFLAIAPTSQPLSPGETRKRGCRTDNSNLKSAGPPWYISVRRAVSEPSPELIEQTQAKLAQFTSRGFDLDEPSPRSDPEDRSYENDRGFRVSASVHERQDGGIEYIFISRSPCAAE